MLKNYLKVFFRNLRKHKVYSMINISGLAMGLASCVLISLYVVHELSYDRYHQDSQNVYRIIHEIRMGDREVSVPLTSALLAPALKEQIPQVKFATSFFLKKYIWKVRVKDIIFNNDYIGCADPEFFRIFTFPFLTGSPERMSL